MNSLDLPQILYQPFAATGDKNTILNSPSTEDPQRANLQTGFPVITQIPIENGGIPPERMDFNGLGYLLSSFYFFTQCGGVYTFNQDVSDAIGGYPLGAVLHYTNSDNVSFNVRSLMENNTYNFVENPEYIDNVHWAYDSNIPKKNIGEIITSSIPLTDAGLHLLDGSLIQGGGIYDDFVQYIADQTADAGEITTRKMMGDYCLYCNGVVVGLICDNNLYIKPTEAVRGLLREVVMRPPYEGAKEYFLVADVDDREYLAHIVKATLANLPAAKPKKRK